MDIEQPSPEQIRQARQQAGLTQDQAAQLVHLGSKTRWAEYEGGARNMDQARWELFLIKSGQHDMYGPAVPVKSARKRRS